MWSTGAGGPEGLRPGTVDAALPATCPTATDSSNTPALPQSGTEQGTAVRATALSPSRRRALTPAALHLFPAPRTRSTLTAPYACSASSPRAPHIRRMRFPAPPAGNCSLVTEIPRILRPCSRRPRRKPGCQNSRIPGAGLGGGTPSSGTRRAQRPSFREEAGQGQGAGAGSTGFDPGRCTRGMDPPHPRAEALSPPAR